MRAGAVCAVAVAMLGTSVGPVGADPTMTTVADGLVTPLGFDVSTNGTIYVGEAFAGRLTAIGRDGERTTFTGRISAISGGTVSTFVDQVPFPGAIEIQRHGVRETIYATIGVLDEQVGGSIVTITP
jgi:hypothetical protein